MLKSIITPYLRIRIKKNREKDLVAVAHKHLGKPYKHGAHETEAPQQFDCSSFIQYCFRQMSIELPRYAIEQARHGRRVRWRRTLRAGDCIYMRGGEKRRYDATFPNGVGHAAVYIGNGRVVHAAGLSGQLCKAVIVEELDYVLVHRKPIMAMRRFL